MSDTSPPPPPGGYSTNPKQAKAEAKAQKAHAKALRPWYKKKRFILPLLLIAVVVIALALGGGGDDETSSGGDGGANSSEADLFPDRPDEKDNDKERNVGEPADLSGYTATVTAAAFQQELSVIETGGYLVADVTLLNRDSSAQSYNTFDWKLITPGGTIIDPYLAGDNLGSGDLTEGGTISGKLIWEVADVKGDYYVIYDPVDVGDDRGVWKVTL